MDGISGAASVIGLVQPATQVIAALGRYISRVKHAESSRAKLLDQIRLISNAEMAMTGIVQTRPLHKPELQALIDDWYRVDGPPGKCKQELEDLLRWLEKDTEDNKPKKWTKKIVWPMKEDKIQAAIRTFEGYMPYFRDVLSIKTFNLVESMITRQRDDELATTKSELLKWLDGFDCTNKHESTFRQRQQTTGDWLLKEELYVNWHEGSMKFIWLHGKAGAGKSVLASVVIDDLSSGLADKETLAYFYCDFRNIRCTRAVEVLRSLAKQLLWNSNQDWLSSFSELTSRKARGAGPPTDFGTLRDLVNRAADLHERPIIVIDAVDECEDESNLVDELTKLANRHCRLFMTSRTIHAIGLALTGLPSITLDDRVDQMRSDMHFHIRAELESRLRLKVLIQDIKDEIEGMLMKKADGMFRWVQCQLDRLNECYSVGDVREVLETLPATLYETYDRMLCAINKKPFGARRAQRALRWLVMVSQPLTLSQLAEVLSINSDKPERNSNDALVHENIILDILGSLVIVNNHKITLSHYSVKEYLTSDTIANGAYFVHRPSASLELATVSIFSLMLFTYNPESMPTSENYPLYMYADFHGLRHLADCPPDHHKSLVKHLSALQSHIITHRLVYKRYWRQRITTWMLPTEQPALCIIIRFGNSTLLCHYLDCYPVRATAEDNPLVFAVFCGNMPCVQLLVEKGLDVNLEGPVYAFNRNRVHKMTPLAAAAHSNRSDQENLVKLLLANGCVVSKDTLYSTLSSLLGECLRCRPAIACILLQHGADPQWLGDGRKSCLHLVLGALTWMGSGDGIELAQMLISAGCDPIAPDDSGVSPFHLAIQQHSTELVEWLLQKGFQLPLDAILHAVKPMLTFNLELHEPHAMLELLLANGISANIQDDHGDNALHCFSYSLQHFTVESIESTIQLLVRYGCDINCCNNMGRTPLHRAAASGHLTLDILDIFLAEGAKLPADIVNYAVQNLQIHPLMINTLVFLVNKLGASCRAQTVSGDNALHCLTKIVRRDPEFEDIVPGVAQFLVDNGCDVHAPDALGTTPLQYLIEAGCCSFVRCLLTQIAPCAIDRSHGDSEGNSVLHRLCRWNWHIDQFEEAVELLQEAEYDFAKDINRPNKGGFTPLCIVLHHGHRIIDVPGIISCLLSLGASFYHVNYLHLQSLDWASNLPWYDDAIGARGRCLTQSKITFDQIAQVLLLLQAARRDTLSPLIATSIMDMAEYWACTKVTRYNLNYTAPFNVEQIVLPAVVRTGECWSPRQLVFSCKAGNLTDLEGPDDYVVTVYCKVRLRWSGAVFEFPCRLLRYPQVEFGASVSESRKVCFDVWDRFTPAEQVGGSRKLMLEELVPGDPVSVELTCKSTDLGHFDHFTLESFQVEIYYALTSLPWETPRHP